MESVIGILDFSRYSDHSSAVYAFAIAQVKENLKTKEILQSDSIESLDLNL